jgi:putative aldouronate transport system substrate-binding protein
MKKVKLIALLLVAVMIFGVATACGDKTGQDKTGGQPDTTTPPDSTDTSKPDEKSADKPKEPITFTMFQADPGEPPPADNKIVKQIQEKTGVTIEIEYLVGDMEQKIGIMIAGGDYPDLIGPGQGRGQFLNAGAFLALDDYLPKYPNLWKHYEPFLDVLRSVSADGKIYIMDIWSRNYWMNDGTDTAYQTGYNGPAFWTQKDVLAWDNYSYPKNIDTYFDMLLRYYKANPTIDGQPALGFEVHSQDWRSFCLKNAPQHLIGGRNEGDVVVYPDTLKVEIYQNKDYAKAYYKKLNEMYKEGLIHPETFSRNYDDYLATISTGRVLAMFDQQWNFGSAESVLVSEGKYERTYVPLGISLDGNEAVPYNRYKDAGIIGGNGMGISVKCKDVERALEFLDFMLNEDIQKLCYWGIEGEDYYVDNGRYRRTEEQRTNFNNPDWVKANSGINFANLFPKMQGRYSDGNACGSGGQPEEILEGMSDFDKAFLGKYGYSSASEFLPLAEYAGYPEVWSIFSTMEEDNPAKQIFNDITDLQNRYLPNVIMSDDFDSAWAEYAARYENVDSKTLEEEIERQIKARYKKP